MLYVLCPAQSAHALAQYYQQTRPEREKSPKRIFIGN